MMKHSHHSPRGFAQLIGVILVSLIGTSIALALLPLSISLVDGGDATKRLFEARRGAESCAELGLISLKEDPLFSGTKNHQSPGIDCTATISNSSGTFMIETTGVSGAYIRRIGISGTIATGTSPAIDTWTDVVDF